MEQGVEPDIRKYFIRILNSIALGFLWLFGSFTAGIYFGFGYRGQKPMLYVVVFYLLCVIGLLALLRYYYRVWKK